MSGEGWLDVAEQLDAITRRRGFDPRQYSRDEVARLLAAVHRGYNVEELGETEDEVAQRLADHLNNETPWCSGCSALLELANVEQTDERVGAGEWAYRPPDPRA